MIVSVQTVPKEGACMAWSSLHDTSFLEAAVILFQLFGVGALCMSRLLPPSSTRCARLGRITFVVAMVGLGIAGAFCGREDSEFALFAGGTMTVLFIGMTTGSSHADTTGAACGRVVAEPKLAS
jgi:hypothetical protein